MQSQIRTRYAPSPTGFQHIGGIRTALYCYLYTRQNNGVFILRSEDTDRARFVPGAEEYIVDSLNWCGMECDEANHLGGDYGPYRQSDRKEIYQQYIQKLLETGHAYYAFDTAEELDAKRTEAEAKHSAFKYDAHTREQMNNSLTLPPEEVQSLIDNGKPYVVRVKIPAGEKVRVNDIVKGLVVTETDQLDDKVMMKADGMPTYHFANVVDDHIMKITHVIRGDEWLTSTPLHVLLYRFFGWEDTMPQFAHLPLILKPKGNGKLSKRDGDKFGFPVYPLAWKHPFKKESSLGFKEIGFLPEAFVNMLVFFGWNPGTEQEVFSMDELIETFSLERISKAGARFNWEKAKWFNQQYILQKTDEELAALVLPFAPDELKDKIDINRLSKACAMMKERMTLLPDFWENAAYLFALPESYDAKVVRKKWKSENKHHFETLQNRLAQLDDFGAENVEKTIKEFINESGLGFGNALQVFRVMMAGTTAGPSIFDITSFLGKAEVNHRINKAFEVFEEMNDNS